jgi:4-carboxymuconolactone decarboxylase
MTSGEEVLFKLAIGDRVFCEDISDVRVGRGLAELAPGTVALMRVSALIAIGPANALLHEAVGDALDAGLDGDTIVGSLIEVAPIIGINQMVVAAPALAIALHYDLDSKYEALPDMPGTGPTAVDR